MIHVFQHPEHDVFDPEVWHREEELPRRPCLNAAKRYADDPPLRLYPTKCAVKPKHR